MVNGILVKNNIVLKKKFLYNVRNDLLFNNMRLKYKNNIFTLEL